MAVSRKNKNNGDLTGLLQRWGEGDTSALNELFQHVYETLRRMAEKNSPPVARDPTLQPTAIINEVYLKLSEEQRLKFNNRREFFGFAGKIIRNMAVDYARARMALKRGGQAIKMPIEGLLNLASIKTLTPETFIALDQALTELAVRDPRQAQVLELRFFAGFSIEELVEHFEVSAATINRELQVGKRWLAVKLGRNRV